MPRSRTSVFNPVLLSILLALTATACGSDPASTETGGGGSGGSGASGGTTTEGGGGTGGSGGVPGDCAQAATMLDLTNAPGAGDGYAKPELSWQCTDDKFIVDGNGIPHYSFVQTTPNPLQEQNEHYEITRHPAEAAQITALPLLATVGFAVNGQPIFTPNEAAMPAESAYGDPIYNNLMDPCLGHTAFSYHYHALLVKCLTEDSLVDQPWTNADPPANEPSPIIAWANDGFPIYGPLECSDAACSSVVERKSGFAQIGDPTKNAWDAYEWQEHAGDDTYLDACNGHIGPDGDYHYHATATFPYVIGCYKGTPAQQMMGP